MQKAKAGVETSVETHVENHVETNAHDLTRPGQSDEPGEFILNYCSYLRGGVPKLFTGLCICRAS